MRLYALADRVAGAIARLFGYAGGAVLLALVALTCISIVGRGLFTLGIGREFGIGPINGDFEMVELGIGFAIFAFLPWTQYSAAHARVDLFAPALGERASQALDVVAQLLLLGAAIVITWRLWLGMSDKLLYGETSMILQLPVWQAYAGGVAGSVGWTLVTLFCVWRAVRGLFVRNAAPREPGRA